MFVDIITNILNVDKMKNCCKMSISFVNTSVTLLGKTFYLNEVGRHSATRKQQLSLNVFDNIAYNLITG